MGFRNGLLLLFILPNLMCSRDAWDVANLNNGKIEIIGHKGCGPVSASNPIPDNSMAGFKKALEVYGADGVEMDVQMSRDGIPFLYHDRMLEVHTNFRGCVSDYTATQLAACKFNNSDEYLVSLETMLRYFLTLKHLPKIFLDTKPENICVENAISEPVMDWYADNLYAVLSKFNIYHSLYIESGNAIVIDQLKRKNNNFQFMLNGLIPEHLALADSMQLYGMMLGNTDVTAEKVKLAHTYNLRVSLFAVNTKKDAKEAIAKSPDFILTDDILLMKQMLDQ